MFLLVDEDTDKFYKIKRIRIGAGLATVKLLPLKPRIADLVKGSDGYGYFLRTEPNKTGLCVCMVCEFGCSVGIQRKTWLHYYKRTGIMHYDAVIINCKTCHKHV